MKTCNYRMATALSFLILICSSLHAQILDSTSNSAYQSKTFYSKILGEKRKINIQLPSSMNQYDNYPVLYLLDGEAHTKMVGGQVQYLSESYKIIPNIIVVGIENTYRMRDLTPTKDSNVNNSGGGENFLQFIKQELMPYIDSTYHPAPYKILSGHSLGALMAVHCLVNHPDYFNAYIAISPSFQWDKKSLLNEASQKLTSTSFRNKILFYSDANEDSSFHQNQIEFESILIKKHIPGLKFKRAFYPEETHISEPVKAFYDGIRWVYPNWHLNYNSSAFRKIMTAKMIREHFNELSNIYGYNTIPLHDELIQIARFLRNDPKRINDAIELLQWNLSNYPASDVTKKLLSETQEMNRK